jgi:UDP-glucose 4-epimerase
MKVLVTGGAGYIGSVVVHALVEAGHQVVVLDDLSAGFADSITARVEFHPLPLRAVTEILAPEAGFEAVLHFAAKTGVAQSVAHPDVYWDTNMSGSMAVLRAVRTAVRRG